MTILGETLRAVREEKEWPQRFIAFKLQVSESLVRLWEKGKRPITGRHRSDLARLMDDGRVYLIMAREATGGPMAAPVLNKNYDEHHLVCATKLRREYREAGSAVKECETILILPPERIGDKSPIREAMMKIIKANTAGMNTIMNWSKQYDISLGELYDDHERDLIEKGYLEKKKPASAKAG